MSAPIVDAVRARFRDRFIATARERVRRGLEHLGASSPDALSAELHALAGEASMIGFSQVADTARAGEHAAGRWADERAGGARDECENALRALERQLDEV